MLFELVDVFFDSGSDLARNGAVDVLLELVQAAPAAQRKVLYLFRVDLAEITVQPQLLVAFKVFDARVQLQKWLQLARQFLLLRVHAHVPFKGLFLVVDVFDRVLRNLELLAHC